MSALERDSRRFREVLANVQLDSRVPSCSEWSSGDLLWHLTEVQHFWGTIVANRLDGPEAVIAPERPSDHSKILTAFDEASRLLHDALLESEDDAVVWTWSEDHTVGFVRRRQAHEALIHRADAEMTAGVEVTAVDRELAHDGIEEMVHLIVGGYPGWGSFEPGSEVIALATVDIPGRWFLQFGRFRGKSPNTGNDYDLAAVDVIDPVEQPHCEVSGEAWLLDRWLWGRAGSQLPTIVGEAELAARLRELIVEDTQ